MPRKLTKAQLEVIERMKNWKKAVTGPKTLASRDRNKMARNTVKQTIKRALKK
jgi:hypothetical protein